MTRSLLSVAVHLYGTAALIYLVLLVRQVKVLPTVGRLVVGCGLVLHGISLGMTFAAQGGVPVGLPQAFSTVALALLAIFFFLDLRHRVPVIGAFLMPIALAVLVPGIMLTGSGPPLPLEVRRPLLPVHITIALLGIAAFGVAAGVAMMYLLMERQMKAKKFGVLFATLPPLQFLDDLNRRLAVWGFIALSITLVTGVFFVSDAASFSWSWRGEEVTTLVAWLGSGALLHARFFGGWQGKRVAMLTMAGFFVLLLSLITAFGSGRVGGVN